MLEINVGPVNRGSSLYQRMALDASVAIVETFAENGFLTLDRENYKTNFKTILECLDNKTKKDIEDLVGTEFIEKKFLQLIKSIRNCEIVPLDVFNQFLLKRLLSAAEIHKEVCDPIIREIFDDAMDKFKETFGKGAEYDLYSKKLDDLYRFVCDPWLSLVNKESNYCGILFSDQKFRLFDTHNFKTALCLMASSKAEAGKMYCGEDYVANLLLSGGVKPEVISEIFSKNPYERSASVDKNTLNILFDKVMDDVMEKSKQYDWNEDEISNEIHRQFDGFLLDKATRNEKAGISLGHRAAIDTKRIYFELIRYNGNEAFLHKVPHRRYMDLAVVYRQQYSDDADSYEEITNKVLCTHNLLYPQDVLTEEDLYQLSLANTKKLYPILIFDLRDYFMMKKTDIDMECIRSSVPVYTLYNEYCTEKCDYESTNTFYSILCVDILEKIAFEIGTDFYVIPFGTQTIVYPAYVSLEYVRQVYEANLENVDSDSILTTNIYHYSIRDNALSCLISLSV